VALYRIGDSGEPVRDIQDRLSALGFPCDPDDPGTYGDGTLGSVRAFQEAWRLPPDGEVGPETWSALVDAGFSLGDRLLYYRLPMLHGDDVAELQRSLNALGFDAGNVDGIFGPDTLRAVLEFQQNRNMAEDGIAGPRLIRELALMVRATRKPGRDLVRERVWMSSLQSSPAGLRVFIDPFCRDEHEAARAWEAALATEQHLRERGAATVMSRSADTRPTERMRARRANEVGADLVVAFSLPGSDIPAVFFFASAISRSEAGEAMAGYVALRLGVQAAGRVQPILRFTRAPAILVAVPALGESSGRAVGRSLEAWLADQDPSSTAR
jgi:N-acetylmuramoyl-L-alanine amidase